jgi:hypothetical protein
MSREVQFDLGLCGQPFVFCQRFPFGNFKRCKERGGAADRSPTFPYQLAFPVLFAPAFRLKDKSLWVCAAPRKTRHSTPDVRRGSQERAVHVPFMS